nr:uncharacterized protein LOC117854742 [Setaria viridis]
MGMGGNEEKDWAHCMEALPSLDSQSAEYSGNKNSNGCRWLVVAAKATRSLRICRRRFHVRQDDLIRLLMKSGDHELCLSWQRNRACFNISGILLDNNRRKTSSTNQSLVPQCDFETRYCIL